MIYQTSLDGITEDHLTGGFFEGWPDPPQPEAHFRILQGSTYVVLAIGDDGMVIGYITAVSDHVSCAYIPYLEVLSDHRGQGIGSDLVRKMVDQLSAFYMIDLSCDEMIVPFYASLGFLPGRAMLMRNLDRQASRPLGPD